MKCTPASGLITILLWGLLSSCTAPFTTFKEGVYKGRKYEIQSRSRSGMFSSTNSLDWRIKLDPLPAVPVNANVTDWGPPYSTDVYGTDAFLYITGKDTSYRNEQEAPGNIGVFHSMLYVDPSTLSEVEFETFYPFMQDEWPRISDEITGKDPREFPHILGLVYGSHSRYAQDFRGKHNNRTMILRIEADGRIRLMNDDKWAGESYSGLSQKVQMPGKRLVLDGNVKNGGLSLEALKAFRNKAGVAVTDLFAVSVPAGEVKVVDTAAMLAHKWHATHMMANGERQPLEQGDDGSYLWLQENGRTEAKDGKGEEQGTWAYNAATKRLSVKSKGAIETYQLISVSAQELILEQSDATLGKVALVFRRLN